MREAFPSLPFDSNIAEEKLLPSPSTSPPVPLFATVYTEERKQEEREAIEQQYPVVALLPPQSTPPSNTATAFNSTAPSHEPEQTIITEKIIINREGEIIKETLLDNDPEKNAILDTDGSQSLVGNLPPTIIPTASATTGTATASSAALVVSAAAAIPSGTGGSGTTSTSSLAAAVTLSTTPSFGELEELQNILHFPEEVALRITDAEYQLFYQASQHDFINDSIHELQRERSLNYPASSNPSLATPNTTSTSGSSYSIANGSREQPQTVTSASTTNVANINASPSITAAVKTPSGFSSTLNAIRKRFEETSAWTNYFILSQNTQDERKAAFACLLRVAISCWNIGNFNGAKEIVDGLKSIKKESFLTSTADRGKNSVYEFLATVFDSPEYSNAVSRALAIPTCRTIPYFKNHVEEIKCLLRMAPQPEKKNQYHKHTEKYYLGDANPTPAPDDEEMLQKLAQVILPLTYPTPLTAPTTVIPTDESTEPLLTPESLDEPDVHPLADEIYTRVLPALNKLSAFFNHHDSLCRELPQSLLDFLRTASNSPRQVKIPLYQPSNLKELEEDYEVEIGNYNPVQPLIFDHGISIVSLSAKNPNAVDHHILQTQTQ